MQNHAIPPCRLPPHRQQWRSWREGRGRHGRRGRRGRRGERHCTKRCSQHSWCHRRRVASCFEHIHDVVVSHGVAADARGDHGSFANAVDHDRDRDVAVGVDVRIRSDGDPTIRDRRYVGRDKPHNHRVVNRDFDRDAVCGAHRVDVVNDADETDVERHKTGDLLRDKFEVDRSVGLDADGAPDDDGIAASVRAGSGDRDRARTHVTVRCESHFVFITLYCMKMSDAFFFHFFFLHVNHVTFVKRHSSKLI